ncbi:hypothetical protein Rsw2DRAFT_2807 [Rhodobacter ferrooxidans]|uniref:Uncharacterized protein n=1 Tax=Rhodobacter ferrooxidans TaxID=371731 RepID=C8S429_9RHOB|nr:hypothetical protein Rsw2DRAFT_2807 [Rhodobacter sp. SW2]
MAGLAGDCSTGQCGLDPAAAYPPARWTFLTDPVSFVRRHQSLSSAKAMFLLRNVEPKV